MHLLQYQRIQSIANRKEEDGKKAGESTVIVHLREGKLHLREGANFPKENRKSSASSILRDSDCSMFTGISEMWTVSSFSAVKQRLCKKL